MKKPSVQELVFSRTYPKPRANDPNSFVQHIQRCLVPEVREEVQRYFGRIDCIEAQYPGLDYTHAPHRRRLASFPWHRRLFRVFDELRLTSNEILGLCTWEGTRAAKERFERESGTEIEITTLRDVEAAPEGRGPRAIFHRERTISQSRALRDNANHAAGKRKADAEEDYSDEDETEEESIGVHLNQQLIAAADARERGETASFNSQWEQWLKEALERNEMDPETILETIRQGRPFPPNFEDTASSSFAQLRPARLPEIPENGVETPVRRPSPTFEHAADYEQSLSRLQRQMDARGRIDRELVQEQDAMEPSETEHARLSNLVETLQSSTTRLEADNAAMLNYLTRQRTETAR